MLAGPLPLPIARALVRPARPRRSPLWPVAGALPRGRRALLRRRRRGRARAARAAGERFRLRFLQPQPAPARTDRAGADERSAPGRCALARAGRGRTRRSRADVHPAPLPPARGAAPDLARRERAGRSGRHARRCQLAGRILPRSRAALCRNGLEHAPRRAARCPGPRAAAGGAGAGQAGWRRAEVFFRRGPDPGLPGSRPDRRRPRHRQRGLLHPRGPADGEAAGRGHRRRLCLPRGSAPASLRQFRAPGPVVRRDGAVLPARRPRLGALCLDQGAGAGGRRAGARRPFGYRRYLDYTAFAGLREMKALIDAEVARKDLSEHLKLGPGGIREVEFIAQLLQLIRGGRETSLRERGLLPALAACERLGLLERARASRLREAYRFLRRVENRVQMQRDEQTHDLPGDPALRERLARGLGYPDIASFEAALAVHRAAVSEEFALLLAPLEPAPVQAGDQGWNELWRGLDA